MSNTMWLTETQRLFETLWFRPRCAPVQIYVGPHGDSSQVAWDEFSLPQGGEKTTRNACKPLTTHTVLDF